MLVVIGQFNACGDWLMFPYRSTFRFFNSLLWQRFAIDMLFLTTEHFLIITIIIVTLLVI